MSACFSISFPVRVSDARMRGTSDGACVLHVAPESYAGGLLALVRAGDAVSLNTVGRRLDLLVPDRELACRRTMWTPPPERYQRGYGPLRAAHVLQADAGCDFDFLVALARTPEPDAR